MFVSFHTRPLSIKFFRFSHSTESFLLSKQVLYRCKNELWRFGLTQLNLNTLVLRYIIASVFPYRKLIVRDAFLKVRLFGWFTQVHVNDSSASFAVNLATPLNCTIAFVFLYDLNRVVPTPTTQNITAPIILWHVLVTNSSRGAK